MYTQFFSIFETSRDRALRISKNIWIWYYPKSAMRAQREELQNASASVRRTGARKKWANKKIGLHYAPQFSQDHHPRPNLGTQIRCTDRNGFQQDDFLFFWRFFPIFRFCDDVTSLPDLTKKFRFGFSIPYLSGYLR